MTNNNLHTANPPSDWQETTLGEVVEIKNEKLKMNNLTLDNYISTENLLPDRLGVQKSANLPNVSSVNAFKKDDTLFSNIRTYFKKVWFAKFDGGASNDVLIFTSKDENKLDKKFLYYFISSDCFIDFTVISAKGTKMPRGDKEAMKTFPILLPPLPEQQAIASVLSAFDDKIELLREENKTLEEMGQALFKKWFVEFDFPTSTSSVAEKLPEPVEGNDAVSLPKGDALSLPKGWRVGKLGEVVDLLNGFAYKSSDFIENGKYRLVTIANVQDGSFVENTKDGLDEIPQKMPDYCNLETGDILLSLTGNVGRVCHVIGENYFLNQRVAKLQAKEKSDYGFVYTMFRQNSMIGLLESISAGTAQQNLSPIKTADLEIIIPSRKILDEFANTINPMIDKMLDNKLQIQSLARSRDALLPRLMSGEVRVKY